MRRKKSKPNYRKIVLRLQDLDHAKASVLNSLSSVARAKHSRLVRTIVPASRRSH
jgi:hypothetical protein